MTTQPDTGASATEYAIAAILAAMCAAGIQPDQMTAVSDLQLKVIPKGVDAASVSRAVAQMASSGLVEVRGGGFITLTRSGFARLAS